jgi:hypothetical protein
MEEVPRYFHGRDEDLLKINICAGEGWHRLAPFVGSEIPDCAFPYLNEMAPDPG